MRSLFTLAVLALLAAPVGAETITTTDGKTYTRARDGHLYPSNHVRADGSVSDVPLLLGAPVLPTYAPRYLPAFPYPVQGCPTGKCPLK